MDKFERPPGTANHGGSLRVECGSCEAYRSSPLCGEHRALSGDAPKGIDLALKEFIGRSLEGIHKIYVVRKGVLKLMSEFEGMKTLELLYPGYFFGDLVLAGEEGVSWTATAASPSSICEFDDKMICELGSKDPQFFREFVQSQALQQTRLKFMMAEGQGTSLKIRLAKTLYRDFRLRGYQYGGHLTVTKILNQDEWALMLMARRETVNRSLNQMEEDGILKFKGDSISLVDEYRLLRTIANLEGEARGA